MNAAARKIDIEYASPKKLNTISSRTNHCPDCFHIISRGTTRCFHNANSWAVRSSGALVVLDGDNRVIRSYSQGMWELDEQNSLSSEDEEIVLSGNKIDKSSFSQSKSTPGPRSLEMSVLMTPDMSNFSGNVHGGALLKLLDQVAYACATQYSRSYVVTLSVDRVIFREPIHVGELVTFSATVNYTGRTSMEVGVRIVAERIETGERRHTNSCYFTMVSVDESGSPKPICPATPRNEIERERHTAARNRRLTLEAVRNAQSSDLT